MEFRHRHQRTGVAGRDRNVGLALLDRVDGKPHRRFPAAIAQSLARLILHFDGDIGVDQPRRRFQRRARVEQRLEQSGIAEEQKLALGMPRQRNASPGNHDGRAVVAAHGIERNADLV